MKIKAIITGATGMVGEGVLQESILHPDVEKVLVINRKPCGVTHPKLTEILHTNFYDMHMAEILSKLNKDMTFCYISGAGTDSSEKGRLSWARVKGKTENDLMKLPFKKAYAFRPGFMLPSKGAKNAHGYYVAFRILYPALRALFPGFVSTLKEVGIGMINSVLMGYEKPVLEVKDIVELAKR
ncbi:MAG: epimerase [Bacteroidia bacterium]|nr:epimerase [Bacteroidia bacterium]